MIDVISMLAGGDRRSIGRVNEVVRTVGLAEFDTLVHGLLHEDEVVRMRCADAIEKISRVHPDWLRPHTTFLLETAAAPLPPEIRWHLAQIMPRLPLTPSQRARAVRRLTAYLEDKSAIVRVNAMQALAEMSEHDVRVRPRVVSIIQDMLESGTPAVKARGRRLLNRLKAKKSRR